jgi:hypothetical protein
MKGGMRIYTREFRSRFRPKNGMERMGIHKEVTELSGFRKF